jgi:3-hydroxyisobutyrate dehydrogenase-like beta-hydroxyacid dehydrogenase
MKQAIGILHPGFMGAAVAKTMKTGNRQVFWASEKRSVSTRRRAEKIGLVEVSTLVELCHQVNTIVCICPPHVASEIADAVLDTGFTGLYVDLNAISPKRATEIGDKLESANITFVDGSIIGSSIAPDKTCMYLSGTHADRAANLFDRSLFEIEVIGTEIGQASALKMCYSGSEKSLLALHLSICKVASRYGVLDALEKQWIRRSQDDVERVLSKEEADYVERKKQSIVFLSNRMWRFSSEMKEIATTFSEAEMPDGFFQSSADIYQRCAHFKDLLTSPSFDEILNSL